MIDLGNPPTLSKNGQRRVSYTLRDSLGLKKHLGSLSKVEVEGAIHAELEGRRRFAFLQALARRYAAMDATDTERAVWKAAGI